MRRGPGRTTGLVLRRRWRLGMSPVTEVPVAISALDGERISCVCL